MGEIAEDIINGECCALCGQYFFNEKMEICEHEYPVACWDCWEKDCGYQKSDYPV